MSLDDVAREIVAFFDRLNIPHAIMGGMAVRLYAIPRPTFDVDFTVSIPRESLSALYAAAEQMGLVVPPEQLSGWVDSVHGLPVVKLQWYVGTQPIDVDLFIAESPFQRELLNRRQRHSGEGWEAWFVTPEDLILLKLLADRPKDRIDIADILFVQGTLDESYLRTWAAKIGVSERLDDLLGQR